MQEFLYQATIYLIAAVIAVPLAARLGLGSVLGYLAAGIVIGPVLGLIGSETAELQHFAEFGVVMMLFLIGLELEPRTLWDMRHRLIGLGGLQILGTGVAIFAAALALGQTVSIAFAIGMILTLSSTAIVLQTLTEKDLIRTQGGRSTFSVLLTQDIAVIPMLAILPLLALPILPQLGPDGSILRPSEMAEAAQYSHTLVEGLPGWAVTLVTLGAVGAIILAGVYLVQPLFHFIHRAKLREMYTAVALLIVLGISFVMGMVGLSPALGAFLAGVMLANSEFRHQLESDIEPFKGLLLGLFFITVGAGINFPVLFAAPLTILGLTLGLIVVKGAVLYALGRAFALKGRTLWLFTLSLAQAGEFGFVLLNFAGQLNVLPQVLSDRLLLVVALSMLVTPLLFIVYDILTRRISEDGEDHAPDEVDDQGPVIIAGIGRFGQIVNRLVQSSGFKTVVIDHDMETIRLIRQFGFKGFFGDPTRPEILHAAGLREARVLVVALDDPAATTRLVIYARRERPDLHIVARARDRVHVFQLFRAGANDIVREMFDSSLRAGRCVLEKIGLSQYEAAMAEEVFFYHDRESLKQLAKLWDENTPASRNPAYIAKTKELERDLEAALAARLEEHKRD